MKIEPRNYCRCPRCNSTDFAFLLMQGPAGQPAVLPHFAARCGACGFVASSDEEKVRRIQEAFASLLTTTPAGSRKT